MTIDDLKAALDDLGRSLGTDEASAAPSSSEALRRSRSALSFLRTALWWEAAQAVAVIVLLAWFLATHAASSWTIPGSAALLLTLEVAYLIATIRQHVLLSRIDYAAPVVRVQRRLGALMALRSRTVWTVLVAAPLVWLPLLIVAVAWLTDVDVVAVTSRAWVAANLALGLTVLGGGLWIALHPPRWVRRSPRLRRVFDHLAGRSLHRARAHADEAATFEHDSDSRHGS